VADQVADSRSKIRWLATAPEFEDAVRAAAAFHGILEGLIRKDYWVTRVLRAIASDSQLAGRVIFKGGTSLSKGWRIIERFSEDIDLLLTGPDFGHPPGKRERERMFRALQSTIETATPLRLPDPTTLPAADWQFYYLRASFNCNLRYPLPGHNAGRQALNTEWLLVESGFRGGAQPHTRRSVNSMLAEFITAQPEALLSLETYAADLLPFDMELLKPERTFVEKLLAVHGWMSNGNDGVRDVRTRHYYDLAQLYTKSDDVRACIHSGEITELVADAIAVSNTYWSTQLDADTLNLRQSAALFPSDEQRRILRARYDAERDLYYRGAPAFDSILDIVREIANAL
jgi:hypothetical protein